MKVIKGICNGIDKFNDILGRVFSVLVLGILGVILCEVVLRRIFNRPQIWTQDLTVMLFACYIILICAYGFQKKAFVAVDVVFAMLPQMPSGWSFFLRAYTTHEQTYSVWAAPTWPVKLCLFIGLALLAIQSVSEILKQVQAIVELAQGKKTLPADGKEAQ